MLEISDCFLIFAAPQAYYLQRYQTELFLKVKTSTQKMPFRIFVQFIIINHFIATWCSRKQQLIYIAYISNSMWQVKLVDIVDVLIA